MNIKRTSTHSGSANFLTRKTHLLLMLVLSAGLLFLAGTHPPVRAPRPEAVRPAPPTGIQMGILFRSQASRGRVLSWET